MQKHLPTVYAIYIAGITEWKTPLNDFVMSNIMFKDLTLKGLFKSYFTR